MASGDLIEEPPPPSTQHHNEPISQRTVQQKEKSDEHSKQLHRLSGEQTNRSRSSSRRARRQRVRQQLSSGSTVMKTNPLSALEEADANLENQLMQPFERIGPDSTSMDGPVTLARAERGEIPVRGTHPGLPYRQKPKTEELSELKNQDGLKLTLEANLDVEIELKASIRGDITLSL